MLSNYEDLDLAWWARMNPEHAQRVDEVYEEIAAGIRRQALAAQDNAFIASSNEDGSLPPGAKRAAMMGAIESMKLYDGVEGDKEAADNYIFWLGEFVLALRDKQGVQPDAFFRHLEEATSKGDTTEIGDWLIRCFTAGKTAEEAAADVRVTMQSLLGPGDGPGDGQSRSSVICESHNRYYRGTALDG